MSGRIRRALEEYAASHPLRLHTPGHKGRLCDTDLTELTDGSFPGDIVAAAERDIAAAYGAQHAHILCGGSSQGVKAAIYLAPGDIVADVNSHRSVFDGAALAGKRVVTAGRKGDVTPLTPDEIERALTPSVGAVVVTSPTYFGFVADIDGIAALCKRKGLMFIIDGAHGAHFGASPLLPARFADRCDICNVSAHKTLGALTQSAILFDRLSAPVADAVAIMGTTSPSYLLYASVEDAVIEHLAAAPRYEALYGAICELKSGLPFLNNDDFTRPVLDCAAVGADAKALAASLISRGVYPELVTDRYIVFLFTAADGPDAVHALDAALRASISELK